MVTNGSLTSLLDLWTVEPARPHDVLMSTEIRRDHKLHSMKDSSENRTHTKLFFAVPNAVIQIVILERNPFSVLPFMANALTHFL